jgi:hypothetical protein
MLYWLYQITSINIFQYITVRAGIAFFIWENDTILNLSSDNYFGNAPDIGGIE